MAVFEKEIPTKIVLDDTDSLMTTFLNTQIVDNHIEYVIRVHRRFTDRKWNVSKRYNDFVRLHHHLSTSKLLNLQLPPKKLLGNMDREFIIQRQGALQQYLEFVLSSPLCNSIYVKRFLDPDNYCQPFNEQALQHVSMALRSDPRFEILKPIEDVGWRLRKHYYSVRHCGGVSKGEHALLSWVPHGPDQHMDPRQLNKIVSILSNVEYSHLEPCLLMSVGETGCAVIRTYFPEGSLRDILYGTKPCDSWISKIAYADKAKLFSEQEIARFGAKILDTLIFLADSGLHYGHLHLGNVFLNHEGQIRLLDLENSLLGLPCLYRPLLVQLRNVHTPDSVDAYCLGHTLYEMAFGRPLTTPTCEATDGTYECSPLLCLLLESLLGTQACRKGLPSLVEIRTHPFFAGVPRIVSTNFSLQLSSQLRQALASNYHKAEARLREDQKKMRQERRQARLQQHLIKEEQQQRKCGRPPRPPKTAVTTPSPSATTANGKSPERSDSPTSTNTSGGTLTPPPLVGPTSANGVQPTDSEGLSALLGSICSFDKGSLRSTGGSR